MLLILAFNLLSAPQINKDQCSLSLPFNNMKPALLYADDALFFLKPNEQQLLIRTCCLLIAFQNISDPNK